MIAVGSSAVHRFEKEKSMREGSQASFSARNLLSRMTSKISPSSGNQVSDISMNTEEDTHMRISLSSLRRRQADNDEEDDEVDKPMFPTRKKLGIISWRELIYWTLDDPGSSYLAQGTMVAVMMIIVFSCVCFCLESMQTFQRVDPKCDKIHLNTSKCNAAVEDGNMEAMVGCYDCEPVSQKFFVNAEFVCIVIFTTEYALRILTVHVLQARYDDDELLPAEHQPSSVRKMWLFWKDTMNLIDFFAIVPFYIELLFQGSGSGLAVLRILRLARVFRVFKLGKYSTGMQMFANTIQQSIPALSMVGFLLIIAVVLCGSMVYFAEAGAWKYDDTLNIYVQTRPTIDGYAIEASPFSSIPASFWWVVITATTVGYGDYCPTTTLGKIVGSFVSLGGIILLALPITIIGQNFQHNYMTAETEKRERKAKKEARMSLMMTRRKRSTSIQKKATQHRRASLERLGLSPKSAASAATSAAAGAVTGASSFKFESKASGPVPATASQTSAVESSRTASAPIAVTFANAKASAGYGTGSSEQLQGVEIRLAAQEEMLDELKNAVLDMQELLQQLCMAQGVMLRASGSGRHHTGRHGHR